ncbi:hypothetical protein [Microbispora sp. CA-102843]|uniref:hypothetical protein n=1 Tax=Microbispora sp. CA-102843 TaxID=3239952 RepID=UPI003D8EFD1B
MSEHLGGDGALIVDETGFLKKGCRSAGVQRRVEDRVGSAPSPQPSDGDELTATVIAAQLGVADFVYTQPVVHERSSNDEVGDGLLIVGERGAVLEVKSREPGVGLQDSQEKAESSVRKFINAAARQGSGSKRTIQKHQGLGRPLQAIPVRAFEFPEEIRETFALELSADCDKWPTIVVVDHPQDPQFAITPPPGVFCISLNDWRELLKCVRSVTGVLLYVERVMGSTLTTVFGAEHLRFAKVCEADRLSARITYVSTVVLPRGH